MLKVRFQRSMFFVWTLVLSTLFAMGCVETVRCPDGEVFDESGECRSIPDAGPADGGNDDGG